MPPPETPAWCLPAPQHAAHCLTVRAGPLKALYEGGFIRYVSCNGSEIVRLINFALRDHNWGTVPFTLENERIELGTDSFRIRYRAVFDPQSVGFQFDCLIEGRADGTILFEIQGEASSPFRSNRTGFTVLHPLLECAGQEFVVTHPDGSKTRGVFPELVNPNQPAFNIAALHWSFVRGGKAAIKFEGEVFEMEDQRNWTDASFKTYCVPLSRPFPVPVRTGDRIHQRLEFSVLALPDGSPDTCDQIVRFTTQDEPLPFPSIGIARSTENKNLDDTQVHLLRQLALSHYRVDVDLASDAWQETLDDAARESIRLNLPLELALHVPACGSIPEALGTFLASLPAPIRYITLLQRSSKVTPDVVASRMVPMLRNHLPSTLIGTGTDAFFAELNRQQPNPAFVDFLSFSINPQVHASDARSIAETPQAYPAIIRSARSISRGRSIHVSPISLKMLWNPNATGPAAELPPDSLPSDVDPRQATFLAAAWMLASVKQLAQAGTDAMTFFETVGERGILNRHQSDHPHAFPAPAGAVFPSYWLLKELAGANTLRTLQSSAPLSAEALCLLHPAGERLIVANLTASPVVIEMPTQFHSATRLVYQAQGYSHLPDYEPLKQPAGTGLITLAPFAFCSVRQSVESR